MRDHDDPVAVLLFGVLCLVAAVGATVWAGAAVATLVAGNGLLGAGLADAARAAVALPAHLGDPAAAWPPPASDHIAGPWLYWPATTIAFAAAGSLTAAALRWRAGVRGVGPVRCGGLASRAQRDSRPLVTWRR